MQKSAGEKKDEAGDPGAQHLADADLFYPLLGAKGGEAEESEAGDENGDDGEAVDDPGEPFVIGIVLLEIVIEEAIGEGFAGV